MALKFLNAWGCDVTAFTSSEAKKAEMQSQFEESVQQLQAFTQEKLGPNGELFRKNVELSAPIFEQVNAALSELAEEDGYDFIFDVAGNGVIVYADPERYNLTEKLLSKLLVKDVMTNDPTTVAPKTTLAEAARTMVEAKIGSLPVVDGGKLVGILTESDFVRYFVAED